MDSRWIQSELDALVAAYGGKGVNKDLATRVYTTRLLGQEPRLVLHGGGNTSVKTRQEDGLGQEHAVLCVKGSGWDMATIEPAGLPAVQLAPLAALARLPELSDEALVAAQRRLLLDPYAPNPSVEAVLHALIPHHHVDHTHANAIVALTNQPDGAALIRDLFPDTTIVPYVMPGFVLAQEVRRILEAQPKAQSLILMNHGIFTFHDDPRQSYEDMIAMVHAAEKRLERGNPRPFVGASLPAQAAEVAQVAPVLRGALAALSPDEETPDLWVLEFRSSRQIRHFVDGAELADYATRGNATPDHVLRIKRFGLVAPPAGAADFATAVRDAVARFAADYAAYFERQNSRAGTGLRRLDALPRVFYVPGLGLFGVGKTLSQARICADIAEATVDVITKAESIGRFTALPEEDLFDIEYWSLEQAKLAKSAAKPLEGQVALITGGAHGLGESVATLFRAEGAEVALLDIAGDKVAATAQRLGALAVPCDVCDPVAVRAAVARVVAHFGGVDILISNAGAAFQGAMIEVENSHLRKALELNFWSHHYVARACVRVMQAQGSGGALVFNITKQVLNPGPAFGPYGISKSALLALMRQYAIEHGADGITSNAVNADRIRSGLLTDELVAARARARGLTPREYMRGNLIGREVRGQDVAEAFLNLARARKTSGAILTVDGGNVAAMVR